MKAFVVAYLTIIAGLTAAVTAQAETKWHHPYKGAPYATTSSVPSQAPAHR